MTANTASLRTVGILKTGDVAAELVPDFGEYPPMFERLLEGDGPPLRFKVWDVLGGVLPDSPAEADAWLVTGSRHGVYDDLPWIPALKTFLRAAYDAQTPIVGVCFGHQILAEALGGRVEKSDKGWGCGAHRYQVVRNPMEADQEAGAPVVTFNAMHQDQVVEKPPMAETFLTSEFCQYAGFVYPEGRALSIQPHPEFNSDFEQALVDFLEGDRIPSDRAAAARESQNGASLDQGLARQWMRAVLGAGPKLNPESDRSPS